MTGEQPLFSVITVCLNNFDGLKRTHQSLKQQTCLDYEWIVVDGASSDGTVEFLEELPEGECRWISEPDQGLYDAMNKGIEKAKGKYLLFLNSGDELADANVLLAVKNEAIEKSFPDFIYGDALEELQDGSFILKRAYTHKMVWYGMFAHHQAMFFLKACLRIRYSTSMKYASDYGFVAAHLKRSTSVVRLHFPVCKFEFGGISQTGSTKVANREQWEIRRGVLGHSFITCAFIHSLHIAVLTLKKRLPAVYGMLRFAHAKE